MVHPLQHSRHWIHHKIYSRTENGKHPCHSLLLSSYSKFAMAELGRNNLRPLIAVSLASTLSRALRAQQGTQLLISTALASLFLLFPATSHKGFPKMCFSVANSQQHLKKLQNQGINSEAVRDHGNQGRCILFSLAALQQQLSVQSLLGPINSRSFF